MVFFICEVGEAFEGFNNAAVLGTNIIMIINDNEMSIATNQGGLYKNLAELDFESLLPLNIKLSAATAHTLTLK